MKVNLLGTSFTLQSDEDPKYLEAVTKFFAGKVEEIRDSVSTSDPVKLAILAGILVVDDLFKTQAGQSRSADTSAAPPRDSDSPAESGAAGELPENLSREELEEAERITLNLIEQIHNSLEDAALENGYPEEK